ncbi:FtsK/SpoIIIE family DNA translocase [Candidatus Desulforudis audaxviator]|uniref:Cell divisionFtsK/SpoIIIE n=1 Tax=Desulforudis audaxviator (strain MP104C) TaxID=477974 RepID=B1I2Z0_DESAP|nr:DNA translocase FtsK [Candidatus Desulforudis audaxviator]ACA59351.1 cell divisionFtsK/SpoIIIE [Candidatus Desulforudis audaxviator MP104C]AZK59326.1 cell division FtsK/SpoIIIE [Candidatus Desulforudis audaxviator]
MGLYRQLKREIRYEVLGLILAAVAVLTLLSLYSSSVGVFGSLVGRGCRVLAGEGAFVLPLLAGYWGLKLLRDRNPARYPGKIYGSLVGLLVFVTTLHLVLVSPEGSFRTVVGAGVNGDGGGVLGAILSWLVFNWFGYVGSVIILVAAGLAAFTLFTELPVSALGKRVGQRLAGGARRGWGRVQNFVYTDERPVAGPEPLIVDHTVVKPEPPAVRNETPERAKEKRAGSTREEPAERPQQVSLNEITSYRVPPVDILSRPRVKGAVKKAEDIAANVHILEETLESFGVKAKVVQVSRGPAITRYEVQPAAGVKVSRIVSLADDISLAMTAPGVRIEAPIPGKAAVGIEVPNKEIALVPLRDLLETKEFKQSASRLTLALGKDIAGSPVIADLAMMPHLLIAGATGAGKSVCLNTLICSLLFKSGPEEVKLLLIDPKMVELTNYNGIPHLLSPVVTNPKKAAISLKWLVREMERRYELFAAAGVRDIGRYNSVLRTHDPGEERVHLPLIVVVIDELADLMMVAPSDVEDSIVRLAQMARAAGIHLVIATQRPSVDVITGLIKANILSRISFAVSSQIDSRTILDIGGAEKLLGRGDMLYLAAGSSKPIRVQGAFLSDKDVEVLVDFLRKQAVPEFDEELFDGPEEEEESGSGDELFPRAVEIIVRTGHASISLLQRRMHIGYARAARLIDAMEKKGIVGGFEGSKPRAVLMSPEQYQQYFREHCQIDRK